MKLLIITQKVDENDSVLGFFHGWIVEFAKNCEFVTVICLQEGAHHLPKNVKVFSLGKENFINFKDFRLYRLFKKFRYVLNFLKYIWQERKNYDAVFVHMNQEYVLLGGLVWKFLGKKITMWRNHHAGNFLTRIAIGLCDKIFCTSKYSFTAYSKKTVLMPVGINTDVFKKEAGVQKENNSLLFLGRMSPVKRPGFIIEALRYLHDSNVNFIFDFYGNHLKKDADYVNALKEKTREYHLDESIHFKNSVPNTEAPHIFNTYEVFINASPSGMYDKTIFEAMACETMILASNANLKGQVDDLFLFNENDEKDLAGKLKALLSLNAQIRGKRGKLLRKYVVEHHSLKQLASELMDEIK